MKELLYGKILSVKQKHRRASCLITLRIKAGVGFINEAMWNTEKSSRHLQTVKVKGFAFRVTGANGYDMTFGNR